MEMIRRLSVRLPFYPRFILSLDHRKLIGKNIKMENKNSNTGDYEINFVGVARTQVNWKNFTRVMIMKMEKGKLMF